MGGGSRKSYATLYKGGVAHCICLTEGGWSFWPPNIEILRNMFMVPYSRGRTRLTGTYIFLVLLYCACHRVFLIGFNRNISPLKIWKILNFFFQKKNETFLSEFRVIPDAEPTADPSEKQPISIVKNNTSKINWLWWHCKVLDPAQENESVPFCHRFFRRHRPKRKWGHI